MNLQQKLMEHGEDHMRIDRKLDNMNAINEDTYQKGTEALSNLQKQGKQIDGINEKVSEKMETIVKERERERFLYGYFEGQRGLEASEK